jgi:hypothetical protein
MHVVARIVVALLCAFLLSSCVAGDRQADASPMPDGALARPPSDAAPSLPACDRGRPSSTGVMFETAVVNAGGGDLTVCDELGGWSMAVPSGWFERLSRQRGREIMSFDPAELENSGSLPPPGHVLVRLQMIQNLDGLAPAAFAAALIGGIRETIRSHQRVTVAGQPAGLYEVGNSPPSSPDHPETTLLWYLRSPFFTDRMVVISLTRPESPLRSEGERIVTSLRFFRPQPLSFIPRVSRAEAIARATSRYGQSLTRIEAKLVLRKELQATNRFGIDLYSDPDALAWVVVYAGSGIPQVRFGGVPPRLLSTSAPSQAPCLSGLLIFPADAEPGSTIGPGCDTSSAWPHGSKRWPTTEARRSEPLRGI